MAWGGGIGIYPLLEALLACPPLPQSEGGKIQKLAIFSKCSDFCPVRNVFLPLDAPTSKLILVLPLHGFGPVSPS